MVSKLYPVYEKHKEIIIEMISKGINKKQIHNDLNLPGNHTSFTQWCVRRNVCNHKKNVGTYDKNRQSILNMLKSNSIYKTFNLLHLPGSVSSFSLWCRKNSIKRKPYITATYEKRKPIIQHMVKSQEINQIHKILELPGSINNFYGWCSRNNIKDYRPYCNVSYIRKYEKEIAKLMINNTIDNICIIINKKYGSGIDYYNLSSYIHNSYSGIDTFINRHFPGTRRSSIKTVRFIEIPWDRILEEMKTKNIKKISAKYVFRKNSMRSIFINRFGISLSQAFYNKFGYEYHRYGYLEQHIETIYRLVKIKSIADISKYLNVTYSKFNGYLNYRYKGKGNLIKYFDNNPDKLQEIMNRYTTVEDDMLDFSEDEYLRQSSEFNILDL